MSPIEMYLNCLARRAFRSCAEDGDLGFYAFWTRFVDAAAFCAFESDCDTCPGCACGPDCGPSDSERGYPLGCGSVLQCKARELYSRFCHFGGLEAVSDAFFPAP